MVIYNYKDGLSVRTSGTFYKENRTVRVESRIGGNQPPSSQPFGDYRNLAKFDQAHVDEDRKLANAIVT